MFYSIRGKVAEVFDKFIVLETQDIGYDILVSNPKDFSIGETVHLFLHHHIREDSEYLVGFTSLDEKTAFQTLLHVNGIGPKSAISILSKTSCSELLQAISNNNHAFIESIPGISPRTAAQIILDLKEYIARSNKENTTRYKEVRDALKTLKFKVTEIDRVLPGIYIPNGTNQDILREALRRLEYAKNMR